MRLVKNTRAPHIFIVDDSLTECLLISRSLQQFGFEVSMATDGREGLRRMIADPPQCLILDIILPGINGYAICRRVRERDPQHRIPIIIVSTKCTDLDRNYALALGADRYLAKPFTVEELVQAVGDVLPASRPALVAHALEQASQLHADSEASTRLSALTLIPYRRNKADLLLESNPFTSNSVLDDQQVSWLYHAIDNHRTVYDLMVLLQIDLQAAWQCLEVLWRQQYIAFYDAERHPLRDIDLVMARGPLIQ
jgi:DNA-binding response OmpR family regulator